jgi:hypothetical protein
MRSGGKHLVSYQSGQCLATQKRGDIIATFRSPGLGGEFGGLPGT